MNKTKIPWCDWTWNPLTGCDAISEGCRHCYAEALSNRFGWTWGRSVFHSKRLTELKQAKPGDWVFVCSMGDFFHRTAKRAWQDAVIHEVVQHPELIFLFLTKRADAMKQYWSEYCAGSPYDLPSPRPMPQNVFLGVSAENQNMFDVRVSMLMEIPDVACRFVSVEPMLSHVRLGSQKPNWIIAGPETGQAARIPMQFDYSMDALRGECTCNGIPFFDKREGEQFVRQWPGYWRNAYDNCCHCENGRCVHPDYTQLGDCVWCPLFQKLSAEEYDDV